MESKWPLLDKLIQRRLRVLQETRKQMIGYVSDLQVCWGGMGIDVSRLPKKSLHTFFFELKTALVVEIYMITLDLCVSSQLTWYTS